MRGGAPARRSNALFVIVVVILVAALAVEGFVLLRAKSKPARPAEAEAAIAEGPTKTEAFGQPSAPIKLEFYAPLALEWHQKTIGLLRKYDKEHPGRIQVKLMPMGNSECDREMEDRGYTCAVIFINGKDEFTLPDGKQVTLQKKPNTTDSLYNSEDVIAVLDGLWAKRGR